jgi:hypothetical protein
VVLAALDGGGALPDAGTIAAPASWGELAGASAAPPCPAGAELVVDAITDELEGTAAISDRAQAGEHLSLVEAVWIAANRPGRDTLRFDPAIFPSSVPATILVTGARAFPTAPLADTCFDARDRGVVVAWSDAVQGASSLIWHLGPGSLQVGLTLREPPYEQLVGAGSQLAACRFEINPIGGRMWAVEARGGVVGPANAFTGLRGVRVSSDGSRVFGDYFGYDPLDAEATVLSVGVHLQRGGTAAGTLIEDNVFAQPGIGVLAEAGAEATIRGNLFGLDRQGRLFPAPVFGLQLDGSATAPGRIVVGPGNILKGMGTAVLVAGAAARLTANSVFQNARGIAFSSVPPVQPPVVTSATTSQVAGTCHDSGTVEVFSDAGDQGETMLGATSCAGGIWTLVAVVPSGRNATATLTDAGDHTSAFSAPLPVP